MKNKLGLVDDVTLVLERDGSVVDQDFDILQHLSAAKEPLMVLTAGEQWSSAAQSPTKVCD